MNAVTWERALQEELRNIRRTSLPNGLTIVSEQMPHLRSISIGIWILKEIDRIRLRESHNFKGIADIITIIRDGLK